MEKEWMNTIIDTYLDGEEASTKDSSSKSGEVLSNDLEKMNASVAAFIVVFLFGLFFVEAAATILYMIYTNADHQSQMIAQGLCKNFPTWQFMENMTDSWCDPRIFNRDFRLEVQCPCFVPQMFRNMTVF